MKCCEPVYDCGSEQFFPPISCLVPAEVERDGKWYCRSHDPVRVAKEWADRNARWKAEAPERERKARQKELFESLAPKCMRLFKAGGHTWPDEIVDILREIVELEAK